MNSDYRQFLNRKSYRALLVMSMAIVWGTLFSAMIFSAPLLLHLGCGRAAFLNYLFFSPLCHQLPERSFSLCGYQLAACARCTGICIGSLTGLLFILGSYERRLKNIPEKKLFFLFGAPMGVDWLLATAGIYDSFAFLRALTGFLMGVILPFYIVPGIFDIVTRRASRDGT